ncbi:glycerol-3-phosphate dehydrogenase [Ralstonia solanacearum]|uniref:glycerol-3-phosphate dehydrogenase n=2 Tax=Ralstonia solanacearum TaxID=305 RepID=UPI001238D0A6|nr:glycerol-3-phosphate dehydrogenase [Ralstonia solanacearum]MDB0528059.1 glycerol-3-phosphate dehydrogenase [Ralstonia solanacearum]
MHHTDTSHLDCDLLVVGGGINGVGIARDAVGRGLSVVLCEKDDLAQHTSSASTKLIHGGLRYLEYYEFNLVRKALQEREVLLRMAPHIMWPLRFVMPHDRSQRPAWMIRAGLFLYDHLARRRFLPGSEAVRLAQHPAGRPLKPGLTRGFVYSDGWVDDARLVVLNARDAADRGARILTRTRCLHAERRADGWHASLAGPEGIRAVRAKAIVNAAGPWAAEFARAAHALPDTRGLRLIKGSHIIVRRMFDHPFAYIFQNPDGRIVFAIPYQDDFTLIGTTDLEYTGTLDRVAIDAGEIDYLCEMANRYFAQQLTPADVVWSYSGVRPLLDDSAASASAITRDYLVECETGADGRAAPLINVWGGKITTYRKLAEEALDQLAPHLPAAAGPSWTATAALPGGDLEAPGQLVAQYTFADFVTRLQKRLPWLPPRLATRYAHQYGTRVTLLLAGATRLEDLGAEVTPGLYEAEIRYLIEHEWARTAQDILWRRTKLGLYADEADRSRLEGWLARRLPAAEADPVAQRAP